jgi:hypothetical protein
MHPEHEQSKALWIDAYRAKIIFILALLSETETRPANYKSHPDLGGLHEHTDPET